MPRIVLIEDEYRIALLRAELAWVNGVVAELLDGRLSWDEDKLRAIAAEFSPTEGS